MKAIIEFPNGETWEKEIDDNMILDWAEDTAREMKYDKGLTPDEYLLKVKQLYTEAEKGYAFPLVGYIKAMSWGELKATRVEDREHPYYVRRLKVAKITIWD